MNHRELIIVLNDAFFKPRHEDKRYRKGWVDAFMTVENDVNTAFPQRHGNAGITSTAQPSPTSIRAGWL